MSKIIILDDHKIFREGICQLINEHDEHTVIANLYSDDGLCDLLNKRECDLLILDISLVDKSGLDILKVVSEKYPNLNVLMLTMHTESHYGIRALKAGAKGYLNKDCDSHELFKAIEKINAGKVYVSEKMEEALVNEIGIGGSKNGTLDSLSDREYEVFRLIGSGKRIGQIADYLTLSVKTVSTYRTRICEKLNLSSTAEVIRYFFELESKGVISVNKIPVKN
jgi:two-component system, NarL family, invasion response regulator UvrY